MGLTPMSASPVVSEPLVLAIDQGTSGTTCLLVRPDGHIAARAHRDVHVSHPHEGWVEQDANELWRSVVSTCDGLLRETGARPAAIGITNQRETLVVFDRRTLEPLAPAIVWRGRGGAPSVPEHA